MSSTFNGGRDGGLDWTATSIDSPADLTTGGVPTGIYNQFQMIGGICQVNYSGVTSYGNASGITVIPPATTVPRFTVMDVFGGACIASPIFVSGSASYAFNGSGNVLKITTPYQRVDFQQVSGFKYTYSRSIL